jgi:hypothetical protein
MPGGCIGATRGGIDMGHIRHDAIVITSWKKEALEAAATFARNQGFTVIGPSAPLINDYSTILICPDGSKEGWAESDAFDAKRQAFLKYLDSVRYDDGSSPLDWASVAYGSDDEIAEITAHAWKR